MSGVTKFVKYTDPEVDWYQNQGYYIEKERVYIHFEMDLAEIHEKLKVLNTIYEKLRFLTSKIKAYDIRRALTFYEKERLRTPIDEFPQMPLFWAGMLDASMLINKSEMYFGKHSNSPKDIEPSNDYANAYDAGFRQWHVYCQIRAGIQKLNNGEDIDFSTSLRDDSIRLGLGKCGFFNLEAVSILSEANQQQLIEKLLVRHELPFKIALLEILGFITLIGKRNNGDVHKRDVELSKLLGIDASGTNVRKTINALNKKPKQSRYDSFSQKPIAQVWYDDLK